jgi:hypothetical protein
VEVTADNLDYKSYKFSVIKQKVIFEKELKAVPVEKSKSPKDVVKGH